ncbi:MAG: carboxypeptidase regulatory-like domain-containing protein [Candidatus Eremiobacteraeota bacterium]|nr:carboxypeptidase regulatory-like domain-containing protein [Candidatus Eremiobacteraeota bacterium]
MRALALIFWALALAVFPALAQNQPTGIDGTVVNADTHKPLVGAEVAIYRMPIDNASTATSTLHTDKHGFFGSLLLEPGRYVVTATANGVRTGCQTSDIFRGAVARVRIEMAKDHATCIGKGVSSALVVPGQTADVYIIH